MSKEVIVDTKQDVKIAMENHPDMKWYIVQTASKSEDAAKRNILELLKVRGVEDKVGMILVPAKKVVEIKNGAKKISLSKNYPSYIFVLAEMSLEVMMCVRDASKVSGFIEAVKDKLPKSMNAKDINDVIKQLDDNADNAPVHKVEYTENDVVRIEDGPFEGFDGVIKKVNYDKEQVDVSIMIFGRETPLTIGFKQVSKAG